MALLYNKNIAMYVVFTTKYKGNIKIIEKFRNTKRRKKLKTKTL